MITERICEACGATYTGDGRRRYCSTCRVGAQKLYREAHADKLEEYHRKYREENREVLREWFKNYYYEHCEEISEKRKVKRQLAKAEKIKQPKPPKAQRAPGPPRVKKSDAEIKASKAKYNSMYYSAHKAEIAKKTKIRRQKSNYSPDRKSYQAAYYQLHREEILEKRRLNRQKDGNDNV